MERGREFWTQSPHFQLVEGDLKSVETVKNFKTLKSGNFMPKK